MPATQAASPDQELIGHINECISKGTPHDTVLVTDERVIARVTDGIYRQPASALRELIANAYDADAKTVSITTDAPRFGSIKVSDDGVGMSPEVLANLVRHIGGSAKRTQKGPQLGVTAPLDPTRSVGGRRLIGKIGIGLFSVAQLSRQFIITTKTVGTNYQLLAHVTLNRFDEAELAKIDAEGKHPFQAGSARIWAERTPDKKGHGTTITLTALLPRVIHILQSRDVWEALANEAEQKGPGKRREPLYHIGQINPNEPDKLKAPAILPWDETAGEQAKFEHLVDGVAKAYKSGNTYARLEHALDYYFQMLWTLGLALPIGYVDQHPFDLTAKEVKHLFAIPDRRGVNLTQLDLKGKKIVRDVAGLPKTEDSVNDFVVSVDGIRLRRPIRFRDYPKTQALLQDPTLFVGKAEPDLSKIPESQRGGALAFSCYFFFVPRVIPQEHNGILVRIHGASGTGFDSTFLKYQVAERQLGQLIAEVFIEKGLEGALNIDRESFNTAHTHYQVLANWVHNAVRLIRNKLKELRSEKLKADRDTKAKTSAMTLASTTDELIASMTDTEPSEIPELVLVEDEDNLEKAIGDGKMAFMRSDVEAITGVTTGKELTRVTDQVSAVARLLEAHGLLQDLDNSTQAKLVAGIVKLFAVGK